MLRGRIRLCDNIKTPFILRVFKPAVYLPSDMDKSQIDSVIAHENAHLHRHDYWWKPRAFFLCVYWFNPLCWVAYTLLCKDIELACDERVVRDMDVESKKDYSKTLLACSVVRRSITACPLAFGEIGVKQRIKSVLSYKKPALWVIIVVAVICVVVSVCLMTNPQSSPVENIRLT